VGSGQTSDRQSDRQYWERHAARYDLSLRVLHRPLPRMVHLVAEAVRGRERVLEVAAGTGLVTVALGVSARSVVATDYAAAMVARLERRLQAAGLGHTVQCRQADLYQLPFAPGAFEAVVAANVLHLVPDLPGALAALRRVLEPGGRLIAPTFAHDETPLAWAASRLLACTGFPGHRRFTARSLEHALEANGLAIVQAETLPGVIPVHYVEATFARPSA
jgi:phosphatidylethanolamine/phosphatidyl-N-methylethanolamine N-methyltransferase